MTYEQKWIMSDYICRLCTMLIFGVRDDVDERYIGRLVARSWKYREQYWCRCSADHIHCWCLRGSKNELFFCCCLVFCWPFCLAAGMIVSLKENREWFSCNSCRLIINICICSCTSRVPFLFPGEIDHCYCCWNLTEAYFCLIVECFLCFVLWLLLCIDEYSQSHIDSWILRLVVLYS